MNSSVNQTLNTMQNRFVYLVSLVGIFHLTLIGNLCVVLVIFYSKYRISKHRKSFHIRFKNSRVSFYIFCLSAADINVALMSILPQIFETYNIYFLSNSNIVCKLVKFIQVYSVYASTYSLIQMGLDRYNCICKPIRSVAWTHKHAIYQFIYSHILSIVLSLPQLFVWSIKQINNIDQCYASFGLFGELNSNIARRSYVIYHATAHFIIPLFILIYLYTKIAITVNNMVKLKNSNKHRNDNQMRQHLTKKSLSSLNKNKIKTFKITLAVVISFILCTLPFFTTQIVLTFIGKPSMLMKKIFLFLTLIYQLNSMMNPVIYMIFHGNKILPEKKKLHSSHEVNEKLYK